MPDNKPPRDDVAATPDAFRDGLSVLGNLMTASQAYVDGLSKYTAGFFTPYLLATQYFQRSKRCVCWNTHRRKVWRPTSACWRTTLS